MKNHSFFVTCPKNLEYLLQNELEALNINDYKLALSGIYFNGSLADAYRVCLWSRIANRVVWQVAKFQVSSAQDLYQGMSRIQWSDYFNVDQSLLIDFVGTSNAIDNSHFGALKAKDAIVDHFRKKTDERPSIQKSNPDIRVNCHLSKNQCSVGFDLSGASLHQRQYRKDTGPAPIKENVASAMLYHAKWPELAKQGAALLDPMCGSGTIIIEALFMAADIAPGFYRQRFGFEQLKGFDQSQWQSIKADAKARKERGMAGMKNHFYGYDKENSVIDNAREVIDTLQLGDWITVSAKPIQEVAAAKEEMGLMICNPPYGVRLSDPEKLKPVYENVGKLSKALGPDWASAIITSNQDLARATGVQFKKTYQLNNGPIACRYYVRPIQSKKDRA